jgi:protein TonB
MLTGYPTPLATWDPDGWSPRLNSTIPAPPAESWRYDSRHVPRSAVVTALLASAALHILLLFGAKLLPSKTGRPARLAEAPTIRLVIPELKELEEPDPATSDDREPAPDLAIPVPMQADRPALPSPSDFVQPLNLASLVDAPDLSRSNLNIIPENYIGRTRIADKIGKIFDLGELDRPPEPVLQPSPTYPYSLRREGLSATVQVEFIVDLEGRVLDPIVVYTDHSAFNEAALSGVARWKFRPGMKGGRKVYVRMRVPIAFRVADLLE